MSSSPRLAPRDWTAAWTGASGLALSTWTRRPDLLADDRLARLLELSLELVVLRDGLVLHGHVVLPDSLHVVAGKGPPGRVPWPTALGRVKAAFARWHNRPRGLTGSLWRETVRVRPLRRGELHRARERCHEAPVVRGLAASAGDWPFSSWQRLYRNPTPGFVQPLPE